MEQGLQDVGANLRSMMVVYAGLGGMLRDQVENSDVVDTPD